MKSQIPGICALLNEKIDELDKELDIQTQELNEVEEKHNLIRASYAERQALIRRDISRLTSTVSTLQDISEGEL